MLEHIQTKVSIILSKASALLILKKFDEAILMYNKVISINPNDEVSFCNKGIAIIPLKGMLYRDKGNLSMQYSCLIKHSNKFKLC